MEHIPRPVRFVQLKKVGTKLKDDRLYAKIVAIAGEFTNQPLKPRTRYWFFVENPHPNQLAQLNIAADSGNIVVPRIDYEKYSLFEIVTSQTPGNSTAIFSVGNHTREFIVQAIMEVPRKDKPKGPAQHESPINDELAPMEEELPSQLGHPEDPMNVEPAPGLVHVEEESPVGQPEAPFDYIIADNGDEPKPRVNLFILIPTDQAIINIFHDLLVALEFRSEVMSDNQRLYSRKQFIERNVLLFPYSDDRGICLQDYLTYASEAVLWLFGAQEENLVIVEKIMHAQWDLLQSASTKRKNLALPKKVTLQLEDINPEVHSTLFAIESHYKLTKHQLVFDAVQAKNVEGIEKTIRGYFNKWLSIPTLTTMEVYVCFKYETNVTTPLEQVRINLYQAVMRAGIPIADFNIYTVVNGSALAYVSCSSSTMWHVMVTLGKLVQELQSRNLALSSIYETTISDVDTSIAREDNAPYRDELNDLKKQMIAAGVQHEVKNQVVFYSAEPPVKKVSKPDKKVAHMPLNYIVQYLKPRGHDAPKLALLIGINKYFYVKGLEGAVNDAKLMQTTLIDRFGFEEENIITLLGDDSTPKSALPTRDNILAAFKRLIELTKQNPGAVIAFHYSGHGSVRPNKDKPTGQNETIVPCDSGRLKKDSGLIEDDTQAPPSTDITDDEIREFLIELSQNAAHVAVVFDSCHSESITRDAERPIGARIVDYDSRLGKIQSITNEKYLTHDYRPAMKNVVVIAACAYNKVAYEIEHDSKPYGALTFHWCTALQSHSLYSEEVTYGDIFSEIAPKFDKQSPKIEGESEWLLYGTHKIDNIKEALVIDQEGNNVQLNVGAVHGVTKGSVFHIYYTENDGVTFVFDATVVSVGNVTLWAVLDNREDFNFKGCHAIEVTHEGQISINLPDKCPDLVKQRIKPYFREGESKIAELVVHEVQPGHSQQFNVKPLVLTKLALVVTDNDNNIVLPCDTSDTKEGTASNLLAYAHYQRHLYNTSEAPWQDQVEFVIYRSASKIIPFEEWPKIREEGNLFKGDYIRFGVRQWSKEKLYFAIIQFDENGAIQQMYPEDHAETSPMPASEHIISLPNNKAYGPLTIDKSIPRSDDAVIKAAFKLYVTTAPTHYRFIEQEGYSVTRVFPTEPITIVEPKEWTSKTIWCTLKDQR